MGLTSWNELTIPFMESEIGKKVKQFIKEQRQEKTIYPAQENVFRAFKENIYPYKNVKMIIIGQDPYYNGSADGLAFSCESKTRPDSLTNIFKELKENLFSYMRKEDWEEYMPTNSLHNWARQGILLMNTSLTVEKDLPNSHKDIGWSVFTNSVIEALGKEERPLVFMLWGNHAKSFKPLITGKNHLILEAAHPSPLSASKGFFGCKHFTKANEFFNESDYYTEVRNKVPIDLRQLFDADKIIQTMKSAISSNKVPFENAKFRMEEVEKVLRENYLWDVEYMFNYSTKP